MLKVSASETQLVIFYKFSKKPDLRVGDFVDREPNYYN